MNQAKYLVASVLICGMQIMYAATPSNPQECSAVQDKEKRLQCYDSAAAKEPEQNKLSSTESKVRVAVLRGLKDPDSAKFGEFISTKADNGMSIGCIAVNAKNAMGGYSGIQQAALVEIEGEWRLLTTASISQATCLDVLKSTAK